MASPTLDHDDVIANIYDIRTAAEFLGISFDMMKTYVSRERRIRGVPLGGAMIFTRQQLENFRDNEMRGPGRPKKE